MSAVTIKSRILNALGMFWDKLKTTYVTSTASNAGDNLALAASAGYNLQTQINTLSSKIKYYTGTVTTNTSGYANLSGIMLASTTIPIASIADSSSYSSGLFSRFTVASGVYWLQVTTLAGAAVTSATVNVKLLYYVI